MSVKKVRGSRATDIQFEAMLDFFNYGNKGLIDGKYNNSNGRYHAKKKWEEMSIILNNIRGAKKTAEQWKLAWRDLKWRTISKARNIRNGMAIADSRQDRLSDIELKVIDILDLHGLLDGIYTSVNGISQAEDLDNFILTGDDPVQDMPCDSVSIKNENLYELEEKSLTTKENPFLELIIDKTPNSSSESSIIYSEASNSSQNPYCQTSEQKSTFSSRRKDMVERSEGQSCSGSEQFSYITKDHTKLLEALAESSKLQASAVDRIAAAMEKQTEALVTLANNDAKRIEVFEKLTDVLSNIVPMYLQQLK